MAAVLRIRRCRSCGRQTLEPLASDPESEAGMRSDPSQDGRP
jgi:hypothetical protein